MGAKQSYLDSMVEAILTIDPSLDRDTVSGICRREIKKRIQDPNVFMDNNVTHQNFQLSLTELCNWIEKDNPIVSGNATFYEQPEIIRSPASNMLLALKQQRKDVKKEMFKAKDDPDKRNQLNLTQGNIKVIMNAEYGASGAPTAAFYTKYSPAATTLMAQSIITNTAAFYESFLGDNMKFYHINECVDWLLTIRKKVDRSKVHRFIRRATADQVLVRVAKHFIQISKEDYEILRQYLGNCSKDELVYLYYANNLKDFISDHPEIQRIIKDIMIKLPVMDIATGKVPEGYAEQFKSKDDYNTYVSREMFMDPYTVPEVISKEIDELTKLIDQYCFVKYLTPDSIVKLNNHKRNTVILVDTDSNVLNLHGFIELLRSGIFQGETFGRTELANTLIYANIITAVLSTCIDKILKHYGKTHNIGEEGCSQLVMKNEFFFKRVFLMKTKKRYASSILLQEGHITVPPKTDIKGMDFIKAGVTDEVTSRFTKMLEKNVLFPEKLQLHELMRDLRKFEKDIESDLRAGGTAYLKTAGYKGEGAYKNPWAIQVFKAVTVWNEIVPIDQKIHSLNKVKLVKLIVDRIEDLDVIRKDHPKEYKAAVSKIFNSTMRDSSGALVLAANGMKVIAIPATVTKIPAWIIPLIDYPAIVSDICNSFRSVLDSFRINEIPLKTPTGKAQLTTGLISI